MPRQPDLNIQIPEDFSDEQFQAIMRGTGYGSSTMTALREVVVNGLKPAEACKKTGVLMPQLSRALTNFRERFHSNQIEASKLQETAMLQSMDEHSRSEYLVIQQQKDAEIKAAFAEMGNISLPFEDALTQTKYSGEIVHVGKRYVFQRCGEKCIIHSADKLITQPRIGDQAVIQYRDSQALAMVFSDREKSTSISR